MEIKRFIDTLAKLNGLVYSNLSHFFSNLLLKMTTEINADVCSTTASPSKDWQSCDSKRQAIIASATRLFLAQGFRQVSMEKIAAAAPVSKATLYHYFDSKEALLAEVISEVSDTLRQTMNQAVEEIDNVADNLEKIAQSFVELIFSEAGLNLYRLVIAESRDFSKLGKLVYERSCQPVLTQLENYLQQLNHSGRFQIDEPLFAADAFFSLLKGDRHFQCLLGIQPLPSHDEKQQLIQQAISFYLRGVLHAVA
jgi:TetR/AcrR family transcriptional regulator, mexJK operon transcriptional repressor